jgi:hypothetical protein
MTTPIITDEIEKDVRALLGQYHDLEVELAHTREKIGQAETDREKILAETALDDPEAAKKLQAAQFVILAGPTKVKQLEARLSEIKAQIGDAATALSEDRWRKFETIKKQRIERLRNCIKGFFSDSAKLTTATFAAFVGTDDNVELARLEVVLNGTRTQDSLQRAQRVLSVSLPSQ